MRMDGVYCDHVTMLLTPGTILGAACHHCDKFISGHRPASLAGESSLPNNMLRGESDGRF